MILTDIFALAKAGYSPKDIKDLIALAEPTPQALETPDPEPEKKQEPDAKDPEPEKKSDPEPEKKPDPEESKVINYEEKVKELEAKIAAMQKENTSKDISGHETKSDDDMLADLVRKYM